MKDLKTIIAEISFEKIPITNERIKNARLEHEVIAKWLRNVPSPESQKNYTRFTLGFCDNVKLNPSELIELGRTSDPQKGYFPMADLISTWREKAKENGVKKSNRRNTTRVLESFFEWNNVFIGKIKHEVYTPIEKEGLTIDKLKKFRDSLGNLRNITLFDFLTSCPLRVGQFKPCPCSDCKDPLKWLPKWKDIQGFPKIEFGSIVIIFTKKGHTSESYTSEGKALRHIAFLNESASNSLKLYKEYREKTEQRPMKAEEPIFVEWREKEGNGTTRRPISEDEVNRIFEQASESSGVKLTPDTMRNFVKSSLMKHGIIERWADTVLGHKVPNLKLAYESYSIEEMFEGTKEQIGLKVAINYTDIGDGTSRRTFEQGTEIAKLKESNKSLEERLNTVEKERDELKASLDSLKERTEALKDLSKETPIDYRMAKALLGLINNADRLGDLKLALQDIVFKQNMKQLAEKENKES